MLKIILTIGTIQFLAIFIQFIKSKFLAIYLGPAGVGIISTIDQFVQLVAYISCLSLPAASLKFLSKSHSQNEEAFKKSYGTFFKMILLLTIIGACLAIMLVFISEDILGEELRPYKLILILGLLTLPTFTLNTLFINVFAAAEQYKTSSIFVIVINTSNLLTSIFGVIAASIFGLYIGNIFSGIIITIGVMYYLRQNSGLPFFDVGAKISDEFKRNPDIPMVAVMLYFGSVASLLAFLVARFSVLKNLGEIEAGLLHGVIALSFVLGMALNPAINLYLSPVINRNIEKAEKVRQTLNFQKKMIFILGLATLIILMFPKLLLTVMFSAKFAQVSPLLFYFVISQFILQIAGIHQALLIGVDDAKIYTVITTSGHLLFAFFSFLTIPYWGIKGAGIAQIFGNSFIFVLTLIRLKAKHGFKVPIKIQILQVYVFMSLIGVGVICNNFAELDFQILALKIGYVILFAAAFCLFLNNEELAYIKKFRTKYLLRKFNTN